MHKSAIIITIVAVLAVIGLVMFNNKHVATVVSTRDLAMSCTLDMYTQFHIHPHLSIIIDGVNQVVPANIGIDANCMHPLHTHDATGTLHVESPEKRDFTLADFFAVWNKPFSKDRIFDSKVDATHMLTMTVNGATSTDYENLVLKDGDQIVINYSQVK